MGIKIDRNISKLKLQATSLKRVVIGLIDAGLVILFVSLIVVYKVPTPVYEVFTRINSTLLMFTLLIIYRFVTIILFNGTIGMNSCNVIVLNGKLQPLSIKEKALISLFILYEGASYYDK